MATADSAREALAHISTTCFLGHASLAMKREMAKTERSDAEEPGTGVGQRGQDASEVVKFTDERRGSSVAEQLIRKEPRAPADRTQHDVPRGNQTQQQ